MRSQTNTGCAMAWEIRANSDRAATIQRRHEFFAGKMHAELNPKSKDPVRVFGQLERELVYFRDSKRCAVCGADVVWSEAEIHHVEQHRHGGQTVIPNGALVHRHCHPKGDVAEVAFATKWHDRLEKLQNPDFVVPAAAAADEMDEDDDE